MIPHIIQILMGAIGSVGFAVLFHVQGRRLVLFFLGGALAWSVYLLTIHNGGNMFLGVLLATMIAALCSEVLARVIHTPVLIMLVPMLVPLIPGSDLYRSMDALVRGEKALSLSYGINAITVAGAICLGIICMTALFQMIFSIWEHLRKHIQRRH